MADPRDFNGYDGIGAEYPSFKADDFGTGTATIIFDATKAGGSAQVGLAVTLVSNAGEIDLTSDGETVLGKLIKVEADGRCTVQVEGGMTLPAGASATVDAGTKIVGALGAASAKGYIRSIAATASTFAQATATETQRGRGMIFDSSVTTAVQVYL